MNRKLVANQHSTIAISGRELAPNLHFVGLGGAGTNAVEFIHEKGIKAQYTCISNPERKGLSPDINFIRFVAPGRSLVKDGKEVYRLANMTQKLVIPKEVENVFISNYRFILLAGLGSYTGTYMFRELCFQLNRNNHNFFAICSIPFKFEGKDRMQFANDVCKELRTMPNVLTYNLEILRNTYGNLTLMEAFERADEMFYLVIQKNNLLN